MIFDVFSFQNAGEEKKPEATDDNAGAGEIEPGKAEDPINPETGKLPVEGEPTGGIEDHREEKKKEESNEEDLIKEEEDQEAKLTGGNEGETGVDTQNQLTGDQTSDAPPQTKTSEVIDTMTGGSQQSPPGQGNPLLNKNNAGLTDNNDEQVRYNSPVGNEPNNSESGNNGGLPETGNVEHVNGPPYNIPGEQAQPVYDPNNPQKVYNNGMNDVPQTGETFNNAAGVQFDPNNPQNVNGAAQPQSGVNGFPDWNPNIPPNGYNGNLQTYPINGGQAQPFIPNNLPNGYNGNPPLTGGNANPLYPVNNGGQHQYIPGYNYPQGGANGNPLIINPQIGTGSQTLQGSPQTSEENEPITAGSQPNPAGQENPPLNKNNAGPTDNNGDHTRYNSPVGNEPNNSKSGNNNGGLPVLLPVTGNVEPQNGPPYNIPGGQPQPIYDPNNPQYVYNNGMNGVPQTGELFNNDPRVLDPNNKQNVNGAVQPPSGGNGYPVWNPNNPPNGYNDNLQTYPINGNNGGQRQPFIPNNLPNVYYGNPPQVGGNANQQYPVNKSGQQKYIQPGVSGGLPETQQVRYIFS